MNMYNQSWMVAPDRHLLHRPDVDRSQGIVVDETRNTVLCSRAINNWSSTRPASHSPLTTAMSSSGGHGGSAPRRQDPPNIQEGMIRCKHRDIGVDVKSPTGEWDGM